MTRLDEIRARWIIPPGAQHYWPDGCEAQDEDVRALFEEIDRLRQAIETHKAERAASLIGHPPDDFDAKLYAALDESEVRG